MTAKHRLNSLPRLELTAECAADLMSPNPVSISESAKVQEAIALFTDRGYHAVPVIDEAGRPVGVLSQSDILIHDRESGPSPASVPDYYDRTELARRGARLPQGFGVEIVDSTEVRDIMTPVVFSVSPDCSAAKVVEEMLSLKIHRLFVVDRNGVLIGVISAHDILRRLRI